MGNIAMRKNELSSLSVDALIEMRDEIEGLLASKVTAAKRELQQQLAALERYSGATRGTGKRGVKSGSKVAPKYVSPSGETWAGRGARPRWLRALLDAGRELSEFAVGGGSEGGKKASTRGGARGRPAKRRGRG
jgi:DNA-binding protein H-NS